MADFTRVQGLPGLEHHLPKVRPSQPDEERGRDRPVDAAYADSGLRLCHLLRHQSFFICQQPGHADRNQGKKNTLYIWHGLFTALPLSHPLKQAYGDGL